MADAPRLPPGDELAALGRRALAAIVDGAVILAVLSLVLVPLAIAGDGLTSTDLWVAAAASAALSGLYHTIGVRLWGKTVGKSACGCVVVRATDGGPVDAWAASIRALVPLVAGAIPVIGPVVSLAVYAIAVRDPLRQGLHDRAAATIVVKR